MFCFEPPDSPAASVAARSVLVIFVGQETRQILQEIPGKVLWHLNTTKSLPHSCRLAGRRFTKTQEGRNCRFQKTPRTDCGDKVWGSDNPSFPAGCLPGVRNPRITLWQKIRTYEKVFWNHLFSTNYEFQFHMQFHEKELHSRRFRRGCELRQKLRKIILRDVIS